MAQQKNKIQHKSTQDLSSLYQKRDFYCQYSNNLPAVLKELNISLAFTAYQAERLMRVKSDRESLDVNFQSFPRIFTQIINFQHEEGPLAQIKAPRQKFEEDITAPRIKTKKKSDKDSAADKIGLKSAQGPFDYLALMPEQQKKLKQQQAEFSADQKN